jgi:hypothetical protein
MKAHHLFAIAALSALVFSACERTNNIPTEASKPELKAEAEVKADIKDGKIEGGDAAATNKAAEAKATPGPAQPAPEPKPQN